HRRPWFWRPPRRLSMGGCGYTPTRRRSYFWKGWRRFTVASQKTSLPATALMNCLPWQFAVLWNPPGGYYSRDRSRLCNFFGRVFRCTRCWQTFMERKQSGDIKSRLHPAVPQRTQARQTLGFSGPIEFCDNPKRAERARLQHERTGRTLPRAKGGGCVG